MSQISRAPVGFLDFFGIKNGGRNPSAVSNVIAPVIDTVQFYLLDEFEYREETGVAIAGTASATLTTAIPSGEVWYIKEFGLSTAPLGAGVELTLQPFVSLPGQSFRVQITDPLTLESKGVQNDILRPAMRNIWLAGGTQFGIAPLRNVGAFIGPVTARWTFARFIR